MEEMFLPLGPTRRAANLVGGVIRGCYQGRRPRPVVFSKFWRFKAPLVVRVVDVVVVAVHCDIVVVVSFQEIHDKPVFFNEIVGGATVVVDGDIFVPANDVGRVVVVVDLNNVNAFVPHPNGRFVFFVHDVGDVFVPAADGPDVVLVVGVLDAALVLRERLLLGVGHQAGQTIRVAVVL